MATQLSAQRDALGQWPKGYDHARLEPRRRILRWLIDRVAFSALVKLDRVEGLENLPRVGPGILMINHIAFVDPIVVIGVLPRNAVPMAKAEVYRYPVFGLVPRLWEVIPVHRGELDRKALRSAEQVLRAGELVLVAPEGTRHVDLQRGKEGMAFLAERTGAPIIPVAVEGTEGFPALRGTKRWRRTGAVVRVGRPFRFRAAGRHADRKLLRDMTDQAMGVLAAMLPEARRGVYREGGLVGTDLIDFA